MHWKQHTQFDRTKPSPQPERVKSAKQPVPEYVPENTADMGDKAPKNAPPAPSTRMGSAKRLMSKTWFKWCAGIAVGGALLGLLGLIGLFWFFGQNLPGVDDLENYRPATVTIIQDVEGRVMGEIYPVPRRGEEREERRYVVELDEIPQHIQDAFVASEDANFWSHDGVDYMGIVRAMLRNIKAGGAAQGASTITQQVARNFLLTRHRDDSGGFNKSIGRKVAEMILAHRMEEIYTKDFILYLYLNEIYFGSGAYGVEAASRTYFGHGIADATLAEGAILAGLPQRPSGYSPHRNWPAARARQEYVIGQMIAKELITIEQGEAALAEEVAIIRTPNPSRILAPHFTEHIRRYLVENYGWDRVYQEGMVVRTTCDLDLQQVAQTSVIDNVTRVDQRLGWRGALETLDSPVAIDAWRAEAEQALKEYDQFLADNARRTPVPEHSTLRAGIRYEAVVTAVEERHAVVGIGANEAMIPLSWTLWGYEPNTERSWRPRVLRDFRDALSVGDIVEVTVENVDSQDSEPLNGYEPATSGTFAAARLYQSPNLEGAMLSMDLNNGAVRAMVGGTDIHTSEFNRVIQAQRQVGSTFKPIVYSAAIASKEFTAGSMILDAPLTFNTLNEELWKPGNYGQDYQGLISLRRALALSRNVCTVRVLDRITLDPVFEHAQNLGITSLREEDRNLAMGLGAASLTMLELTRAYSAFATYGNLIEPYFVEDVYDRDGVLLEQHQEPEINQVMEPAVAGITTWLLREVARYGTGAKSNQLGIEVAGKTGTTNDFKDGWFVGFSPDVITTAWVGYDQPASMGVSSTGGDMALPIWMDYMAEAQPQEIARRFPSIPDIQMVPIDESTGRVASGGRMMPFLSGTIPSGPVVEIGQQSAEDLLTIEF